MIAIYNPNSDPTLQRLPLPTDTEIAEFDDIAGFLQFLSDKRDAIGQIILPIHMRDYSREPTSENIATVKNVLPHVNHHRRIIATTYGSDFSGKQIYNRPKYRTSGYTNFGLLLAKILTKDYAHTNPYDVGDIVGKFAGKVTLILPDGKNSGDYLDDLHKYLHGLDVTIK